MFERQMSEIDCDVVIDMISFTAKDAETTIRLFRNRVKQLIICSSVAAYKRPFTSIPIKEACESLVDSPAFAYSYQKAEMERYICQQVDTNGLAATVIRPSLTYGVGGMNVGILRQNANIVKRIRNRKPLVMFGDGTMPWNFTFAEDLADAFVGAVANEKTYGKAYHATNQEVHYWDDLYYTFGKVLGVEPQIVHLPTEILYEASPELFGHLHFEKMYVGHFDNASIRTDVTMFNPQISLEEGLGQLVEWYDRTDLALDSEKDQLEDKLVNLYCELADRANMLFA